MFVIICGLIVEVKDTLTKIIQQMPFKPNEVEGMSLQWKKQ